MEKSDHVYYVVWEFQLEAFLKDKELWGHIDGSTKEGSTAAETAG